jgi:hypothetical protein
MQSNLEPGIVPRTSVAKPGKTWGNMDKTGKTWGNLGKTRQNMGKSGKTWEGKLAFPIFTSELIIFVVI